MPAPKIQSRSAHKNLKVFFLGIFMTPQVFVGKKLTRKIFYESSTKGISFAFKRLNRTSRYQTIDVSTLSELAAESVSVLKTILHNTSRFSQPDNSLRTFKPSSYQVNCSELIKT